MEICNVCKTPHFLCLSGISRDCELRSAQPISAPSHSAGEQPCAAGRAALSTAGFVMLQLGAGYLSPFTYSGLHFPSFSLINKWKKYILKKKKKKKRPSLAHWALTLLGTSQSAALTLQGQQQWPSKGQHPSHTSLPHWAPLQMQSSICSPSLSPPHQEARIEQNAL